MKTKSVILTIAILTFAINSPVLAQTDGVKLDSPQPKIARVSAVRVHKAPQMSAEEVTRLKLGTVVSAVARSADQEIIAGKTGYWYRLDLPNGATGWVFGGQLADYAAERRSELVKKIVDDALEADNTDFDDRQEIYDLAASSIADAKDTNTRAEFEMLKLLALAHWATTVEDSQRDKSPYREWLKLHSAEVIQNESGGGYALRTDLLWNLEAKYHTLPVGEEIAWEATKNVSPSDCESDEICGFLLTAEQVQYLKRHPRGAHAREAVKNLNEALSDDVVSFANDPTGDENVAAQRKELRKALTELRLALAKVSAPEKAELLKKVAKMK